MRKAELKRYKEGDGQGKHGFASEVHFTPEEIEQAKADGQKYNIRFVEDSRYCRRCNGLLDLGNGVSGCSCGDTSVLQDDPFPPLSQRARIAGLFQQLALWLDEAGKSAPVSSEPSRPYDFGDSLKNAAQVCVELSHAVLEK